MKTIKQLLEDADPLRDEPTAPGAQRESRRQFLITAASLGKRDAAAARFPLIRFAVVSFLVIGIVFFGWRVWPRTTFESYAAVRFEVRLAEDHAEPGLREANIEGTGRSVYLHEEVVVSNGDIAQAEVIPGNNPSEFWVSVQLSEFGAQKMHQATEGHLGKPIALIVDDQVVVAPTVKSPVGPAAVISGRFTKDRAERIVHGIGAY